MNALTPRERKALARRRHNQRVLNMRKNNNAQGALTTGEMRAGLHYQRHFDNRRRGERREKLQELRRDVERLTPKG